MKRLTFISAALLSSALAFPLMAQDSSGGTGTPPPILEQPDANAATKADRPAAKSAQEIPPVQSDGSQAGSGQNAAGAAQDDGTAAAGAADEQTGQSGDAAATAGAPATEDKAAGAADAAATEDTAAGSAETQPPASEDTAGASNATQTDDAAAGAQQDQAADQNQADVSSETTASVNITTEQKTEIRNVIVESDVEPVSVDFDVSVGVAVPATVTLAPLPTRVIEIVPQYEGYRYFVLADGRIIIVEPDTLEIVYVLVV